MRLSTPCLTESPTALPHSDGILLLFTSTAVIQTTSGHKMSFEVEARGTNSANSTQRAIQVDRLRFQGPAFDDSRHLSGRFWVQKKRRRGMSCCFDRANLFVKNFCESCRYFSFCLLIYLKRMTSNRANFTHIHAKQERKCRNFSKPLRTNFLSMQYFAYFFG